MASTERALETGDLAGCLALSESAHWNQNEADWRLMLALGRGWGLTSAQGTLAASTVVLPYGDFAWVSMVLVSPEHRRKGYATRLLRTALAHLEKRGQTPVLDATPAGRDVYAQEGFGDRWGFRRYASRVSRTISIEPVEKARSIRETDWPDILELDRRAFGGDREIVLRDLARRQPQAAHVAERDGRIAGFVLGRDGREANQIGPLVAVNAEAARALMGKAISSTEAPVYVDVVDREPALAAWIESLGFAFQRPFTRMVRGAARAPGEETLVFCPAGPELG